MRIYFLLVFVVSSSCQDYSSLQSYGSHVLQRRAAVVTKTPAPPTKKPDWALSNPDIKTHLTTASQVFTTLGDIKSAQNFAERYFEIKPLRLVSALKGISIAAAIFGSFINVPNEETEKILNNMNKKFGTMFRKMDSQTSELKSYIDQVFLNTFILAPITTAEEGMNAYKKTPNAATKAAFLEKSKMANLPEVVNRILLNAPNFLTNAMERSRNNRNILAKMNGVLVHSLHKALVIEFYRNGIAYKDKLLVERLNTYQEYVQKTINGYKKIRTQISNKLKSSFFPGFIEDDIIRSTTGLDGGDNCKISDDVLAKLNTSYPWRQYGVIVADQSNVKETFAYVGPHNRTIVSGSDNAKYVLIFMASEKAKEKYDIFIRESEWATMTAEALDAPSLNSQNMLNTMTAYARNAYKDYQLAVFSLGRAFCLRTSKKETTTDFTVQIPFEQDFSLAYSPVSIVIGF